MKRLSLRGVRLVVLLAATVANLGWTAESEPQLPTRHAAYQVERNGKFSGTTEWIMTHDSEQNRYGFTTSLKVKGILWLALPNPVVERSEFSYRNGQISPLER